MPGKSSQAHLVRRITAPLAALVLVAAGGVAGQSSSSAAAVPADQAVTQPPEPVDPSPIDGESYYLINQASGLQADLDGSAVVEKARSFTNLSSGGR